MKINSIYTPTLDAKGTLRAVSFIHKFIFNYFDSKLNPIFVELPAFYREDSDLLIFSDATTRNITFDFGDDYDIGMLPLFHSNWRRMSIQKMDLQPGEALRTEGHTIWRDVKTTNTSTSVHDELTYVVIISKEDDPNKEIENILNHFQEMLSILAKEIEVKFNIPNKIQNKWNIVDTQILQTEMPTLKTLHREEEVLKSYNNFILKNPGAKTIQGTIHSYRAPEVYDLNKQYCMILKDRVNFLPINIGEISLYANGGTLLDQLNMFDMSNKFVIPFYSKIINNGIPNAIEIKIHKSKLYMALLGKAHIAEVQASATTLEKREAMKKEKINFI